MSYKGNSQTELLSMNLKQLCSDHPEKVHKFFEQRIVKKKIDTPDETINLKIAIKLQAPTKIKCKLMIS